MSCPLCQPLVGRGPTREVLASGTELVTDEPRCGFDAEGVFTPENWNCQTLVKLRGPQYCETAHCDDQSLHVVPLRGGRFVVLGWYKNRGRTEIALLVEETESRPLRLDDLAAVSL